MYFDLDDEEHCLCVSTQTVARWTPDRTVGVATGRLFALF